MLATRLRLLLQRSLAPQGCLSSWARWIHQETWDQKSPTDVCVVSAARTPMGSFQGSLCSQSATDLGAHAIKGALQRAGLMERPEVVDELFMGNVLSANLGQAPARQAALKAGLPHSVPCTTMNKVCASGMKAIMMGVLSIKSGQADMIVAGGMESMSNVPFYLPAQMRSGKKSGDFRCVDGMIKDGLWDPHENVHMGSCGEMCAAEYNITREAQDDCAIESFQRAIRFREETSWEHVSIPIGEKGDVACDDGPSKLNEAKLRTLLPAFQKDKGTITAGNASQISDGAAAVVLASRSKADALSIPVLGRFVSMADAAQSPAWFTTSPALAFSKAIHSAGIRKNDVDFVEINEAFAVVKIVNESILGLDPSRVNAHGGAIALGHPIGCSGARIIVTLMNVLRVQNGQVGAAAICNGGGGASAMILAKEG